MIIVLIMHRKIEIRIIKRAMSFSSLNTDFTERMAPHIIKIRFRRVFTMDCGLDFMITLIIFQMINPEVMLKAVIV